MASIYEKCKICKHSKFDKSCGIICGLTMAKPTIDKNCQDFITDQKAVDVAVYTRQSKKLKVSKSVAISLATVLLITIPATLRIGRKIDKLIERTENGIERTSSGVYTRRLDNSGFVTLATSRDRFGSKVDKLMEACTNNNIKGMLKFGLWYNQLSDEEQKQVKEIAEREYEF